MPSYVTMSLRSLRSVGRVRPAWALATLAGLTIALATTKAAPPVASSAAYLLTDTATQGNWKTVYGADGAEIVGDSVNYPAYAAVGLTGQLQYTWAASTTDVRALRKAASATDRIAATHYAATNFTIDVNLTDGETHRVALYLLDWNSGRAQTIEVLDAATDTVLDARSVAGFTGGQYVVWHLSGHVKFRITRTAGANAVVSGIFFDTPAAGVVPAAASFVAADAATLGNWPGVYGGDGANIVNDSVSYPAYATVATKGQLAYTWTPTTSESRALRRATNPAQRIASAHYSPTDFIYDVNLTDGGTHQVALYLVDWDTTGRNQRVDVLDGVTGGVLDSWVLGSFNQGAYLVWNVAGHVIFRVTRTAGINAVASGFFFDTLTSTPPQIISPNATTFVAGAANSFVFQTTGSPAPTLSVTGDALPGTLSFIDNGNGTATLSGNPGPGTGGIYNLDVQATNGNAPDDLQDFTLTIAETPAITSANAKTFNIGQPNTFAVLASGSPTPAITLGGDPLPGGVGFVDNGNGTATLSGNPAAGTAGTYALTFTATNLTGSVTQHFALAVNGPVGGPTATYLLTDTATQGNWKGVYGSDGAEVVNDSASFPAYATVGVTGQSGYTWAASTTDVRALRKAASATDRIAAAYYSATSLTYDVNLAGATTRQVALYVLDWDSARTQTIQVLDGTNDAVLDTRTASAFGGGQYLVWRVTGHVKFRITKTAGANAVVSGIFFDTPTPGLVPASASFAMSDTTTQGNWSGVYGADGFSIANSASVFPIYASGSELGRTIFTWQATTTDVRALQKGNPSERIASTNYSAITFIHDVHLLDASTRRVGLYLLDWDNKGRTQTVDVLDGVTGATLDTRSVAAFVGGRYLFWTIKGHVIFRVTRTGGPNAVASGIFFDTIASPPDIVSANTAKFTVGTFGSFTVETGGNPVPIIVQSGAALPANLSFVDNGDGTATLSGTPQAGTAGNYAITFTASNGQLPDAAQPFTLEVGEPPSITTEDEIIFRVGEFSSFGISTAGFPTSTIVVGGAPLPSGVNFADHGNGTATLSGTPDSGTQADYALTFTASNGHLPDAVQNFTLKVRENEAPTIDAISEPAAILEDAGVQTINLFGISAGAGETQPLQVTATSDNPGLIPHPTVSYTSPNPTGSITYTPMPEESGSALITVTVTDGGFDNTLGTAGDNKSTSVTFIVVVTPVNDPPTLDPISGPSPIPQDSGQQIINLQGISAGGFESQPLQVTATSNNTAVIPHPTVDYTSPAPAGSLTYTPVAGQFGVATIQVDVTDGGLDGILATAGDNATFTRTFVVEVLGGNTPPVAENKNYNAQANMKISLGGLLTGVTDADTGVNGCNPTFSVSSMGAPSPGGTISNLNAAAGTFDFDPPPGHTGNVTFNYTVDDSGCPGTATSAPASVTINVQGPVIWFVNPHAATNGDGRLSSPFKFLTGNAGANNDADDVDAAGHSIFVYSGSVNGGITLNANERLIGQGAAGTTFDALMGITPPAGTIARPSIGGIRPTVSYGGTASNVALSTGNVVRGFDFISHDGSGITGTNVGSLRMSEIRVQLTGTNPLAQAVGVVGGTDLAITGTSNTLVTNSGLALNLSTIEIDAAGVTFQSISAGNNTADPDPLYGILLDDTGTTGFVTVTGDGATTAGLLNRNGSGGTIQNAGDHAVSLNNASNVTLRQMTLANAAGGAVASTDGGNIKLSAVSIDSPTGHGWQAINITGANAIDNNSRISNWQGIGATGLRVQNQGVSFTSFLIDDTTFTTAPSGDQGVVFAMSNNNLGVAAAGAITVRDSTFIDIRAQAVHIGHDSGGIVSAIVQHNTFSNLPGPSQGVGNNVDLTHTLNGRLNFTIGGATGAQQNTFSNVGRSSLVTGAIGIQSSSPAAVTPGGGGVNGTIKNNLISSVPGTRGIRIALTATNATAGDQKIAIENNTITATGREGIMVTLAAQNGRGLPSNHIIVRNNVVGTNAAPVALAKAITLESSVAASGGTATTYLLVQGNSAVNDSNVEPTLNLTNLGGNAGNASTLHATVLGNSLTNLRPSYSAMITSGPSPDTTGAGTVTNLDLNSANTSPNTASNLVDLRAFTGVSNIEDLSGLVQTFVSTRNNNANVQTSGTFTATGDVTQPTAPDAFLMLTADDAAARPNDVAPISREALDRVVSAAITRWAATGLTPEQLERLRSVRFEVADVPGSHLGVNSGGIIQVDATAAGHGWFIGGSDDTLPADRADLLTAIVHELGHALGLDDRYDRADQDDVMYGYLSVGERRLPERASPGPRR